VRIRAGKQKQVGYRGFISIHFVRTFLPVAIVHGFSSGLPVKVCAAVFSPVSSDHAKVTSVASVFGTRYAR
jgi:hypothetical protein